MTPDELMGTISITTPAQHAEVSSLVETLKSDWNRESSVAASCERLLSADNGDRVFGERRQLERMGSDAQRRCEILQHYIDWGESLLRQSSATA